MTDNTFTRVDLSEFDGIDGVEWCEDVCNYDEDGFLDQPEPNGDVYEAIEDGRLVAHVYMRPAATIIVNAPRFLAALRAAYAENDRLEAEMKPMLVQMESFLEFAAKHSQALALVEALTNFLADVEKAGKPMTTQLVVGTPENSLPLIHLWATTDDQDPAARGRYLREDLENLKAENENLRAELAELKSDVSDLDKMHIEAEFDALESGEELAALEAKAERLEAEIDRLRANALEWVTVTEDPATLPEYGKEVIHYSDYYGYSVGSMDESDGYDTQSDFRPGDRWAYIPEVQP